MYGLTQGRHIAGWSPLPQVGLLLVSAEVHGPSSPHHARMERFLERFFVYLDHVLLLSPSCLVKSL